MSSPFDHTFWQLRELQRALGEMQSQRRILEGIPRSFRDQIDQLIAVRDRFTLPPDYLDAMERVQETLGQQCRIEQLALLSRWDNDLLRTLRRSQDEIDELARQMLPPQPAFSLPSEHIAFSLAATEALLELKRLDKGLLEVALQPQLAFQDFARHQLQLASVASDALKESRLMLIDAAADLLPAMSSGLELALLIHPQAWEAREAPLSRVNVYTELETELEAVDLEKPEIDVEAAVTESRAGRVAELGHRLIRLVYDLNTEAEREGLSAVFKPTNRSFYACLVIPTGVATDERDFSEVVDHLYFLLYEGSGEAKRLMERTTSERLEALWRLKQLRLGFRHDVDHGSEAEKKSRKIGEAYEALIGAATPRSRSDWARAQAALYEQLVEMLEDLWFGRADDVPGESFEAAAEYVLHKNEELYRRLS